jgi:hypothetical protein
MPDIRIQCEGGVALTKNQIRGFWAAWSGVAFNGMDSFAHCIVRRDAVGAAVTSMNGPSAVHHQYMADHHIG